MKHLKRFKVFAPLYYFAYQDRIIPVHNILRIQQFKRFPRLKGLQKELSRSELEECASEPYWLTFEYDNKGMLDDSDTVTLFLLALWLEVPTRTHVEHIFKISKNKDSKEKSFVRCLDRFQWNKKEVMGSISEKNIKSTFSFFDSLLPVAQRKKRLYDALVMTVAGCMAYRWQVAYMSFAVAIEALLTYRKGLGITKRLAKSYTCLVERDVQNRNKEFRKFIKLYKIRSDIVHGRMHRIGKRIKNKSEKRLALLSEFSLLLRNLWKNIIMDKAIIFELEKGDKLRERFFNTIEAGYMPPKVKI